MHSTMHLELHKEMLIQWYMWWYLLRYHHMYHCISISLCLYNFMIPSEVSSHESSSLLLSSSVSYRSSSLMLELLSEPLLLSSWSHCGCVGTSCSYYYCCKIASLCSPPPLSTITSFGFFSRLACHCFTLESCSSPIWVIIRITVLWDMHKFQKAIVHLSEER